MSKPARPPVKPIDPHPFVEIYAPVWVSGRGHAGPNAVDFFPHYHGDGTVFVIGPEEPDDGVVT